MAWTAAAAPAISVYGRHRPSEKSAEAEMVSYLSEWHLLPDMIWTGSDYWARQLGDWHIRDGRLLCDTTGKNRNIQLLTYTLHEKGNFLQSSIRLTGNPSDGAGEGVIGFLWGIRGNYDDYRSACTEGEGITAGINQDGYLVLDDLVSFNKLEPEMLHDGVDLKLFLNHGKDQVRAELSVWYHGQPMVTLQHHEISVDRLPGNIGLIADFDQENPSRWSAEFAHWELRGDLLERRPDRAFGPVYFAQYTMTDGILRLGAQMAPAALSDQKVMLEMRTAGGEWVERGRASVHPDSRTVHFELPDWDHTQEFEYQLSTKIQRKDGEAEKFEYIGMIPAEPLEKDHVTAVAFSGMGMPQCSGKDLFESVRKSGADLAVFFVEGPEMNDIASSVADEDIAEEKMILKYLYDWITFGWVHRDVFREIPSLIVTETGSATDDSVVAEAVEETERNENPKDETEGSPEEKVAVSGEAKGRRSKRMEEVVALTQTGHMPQPLVPGGDQSGNDRLTRWEYGGIDFAVLNPVGVVAPASEDGRRFGSGGWASWIEDWKENTEIKVLLSGSVFRRLATPVDGRDEAAQDAGPEQLYEEEIQEGEMDPEEPAIISSSKSEEDLVRNIRKAFVTHLAGMQNPPSVIQYGSDEFGDGSFAFTVPSLAASSQMQWSPVTGAHRPLLGRKSYTGDFEDENGGKMTVFSVAGPGGMGEEESLTSAAGFGVVQFDKRNRRIRFACRPLIFDVSRYDQDPFGDWPFEIGQQDHFAGRSPHFLPPLIIEGMDQAIVRISKNGELMSVLKIRPSILPYVPRVPQSGNYHVEVQSTDGKIRKSEEISTDRKEKIIFRFS